MQIDETSLLILDFDGSEEQMAAIRLAMVQDLQGIPDNHPANKMADVIHRNLAVAAYQISLGESADTIRLLLFKDWRDALRSASEHETWATTQGSRTLQ